MLNRRGLITGTASLAVAGLALPAQARSAALDGMEITAMRGPISGTELGARPGGLDDQSRAFERMLRQAAENGMPVFLPPGTYVVSNLELPRFVRLSGVPGASRIVYGGGGHLLAAEDANHIELRGLVLDGGNGWIGDHAQGLLDFRRVAHAVIEDCQIIGSGKNGIAFERVGGRIDRSTISGAAEAGILSVESVALSITANTISECANGGILVHRWQPADDGTIVTGNRIQRIASRSGGTGQFGNGINLFRANKAVVSGNIVSDCAFSSIRANSSSNIQVSGNTCSRSGETAILAEVAFEGAVIGGNIVDGAANGISIVNSDHGGRVATCSGNMVRNLNAPGPYPADPPGFGIGISVEADTTVTGNLVEGAPLYGIGIGWGPYMRNVVATGNVVRDAGTGIAVSVVDGAGPAVIADNVIVGSRHGAVVGHRWAEPATGDMASGDHDPVFAHLTVGRNHVG